MGEVDGLRTSRRIFAAECVLRARCAARSARRRSLRDLVAALPRRPLRELALTQPARRCVSSPSRPRRRSRGAARRTTARTRGSCSGAVFSSSGLALRARAARASGVASRAAGRARAVASPPFRLRGHQARVWCEAGRLGGRTDLACRGRVGSGKTVIALLAAVAVPKPAAIRRLWRRRYLLAEQHERPLRRLSRRAPSERAAHRLLTASSRARGRQVRAQLAAGALDHRRRHARAGAGGRGLPSPRARGDRRAAPLRACARAALPAGEKDLMPHAL